MSAHSRGPWVVRGSSVDDATGRLVAVIASRPDKAEQLRNELIVGAATELLEALELAREALTHDAPSACWATGPNTGDPVEDLVACPGCRAVSAARAAIAKATGGAR